jgi:hypothetical protein
LAPVAESVSTPRRRKRISWYERARYALKCALSPFKKHMPPNGVLLTEAVTSFLNTMIANAGRTSAAWVKLLDAGLEDCKLNYDERRAFFDPQPVEDYYFAGVVAMEAVRIRALFTSEETDAIMGEIGARVDRAAGRHDRIVSELLFEIVSRISLAAGAEKMPYDQVTKAVLIALGIRDDERTEQLLLDKVFRHTLGEPLALGFRNWWAGFLEEFVIFIPEEEERNEGVSPARPWRPKRASTF